MQKWNEHRSFHRWSYRQSFHINDSSRDVFLEQTLLVNSILDEQALLENPQEKLTSTIMDDFGMIMCTREHLPPNKSPNKSSDEPPADIPHRSQFPSRKVPPEVRIQIARAVVKGVSRNWFLQKGYTKQEISSWKIQLETKGEKSFIANGRPLALDDIAMADAKRQVFRAFTDSEPGKVPEGMKKPEVVKLLNKACQETYERRKGTCICC